MNGVQTSSLRRKNSQGKMENIIKKLNILEEVDDLEDAIPKRPQLVTSYLFVA